MLVLGSSCCAWPGKPGVRENCHNGDGLCCAVLQQRPFLSGANSIMDMDMDVSSSAGQEHGRLQHMRACAARCTSAGRHGDRGRFALARGCLLLCVEQDCRYCTEGADYTAVMESRASWLWSCKEEKEDTRTAQFPPELGSRVLGQPTHCADPDVLTTTCPNESCSARRSACWLPIRPVQDSASMNITTQRGQGSTEVVCCPGL